MDFRKIYFEVKQALEGCIETMSRKNKFETSTLLPWRESVLTIVEEKIEKRKQKIQPKQTKPILCGPDVKSYLEALHKRFVFVTIDKVATNFAFTCKKIFYL